MPKPTFFKLPNSKRKLFIKEAYKEFSYSSFAGASITNLVKSLGIAKGSVYQYFEDKEELYNYLVTDANNQLSQLLDKACAYNGEDFFDWYTKLLMVEVKFYLSFPQYAILFNKLMAESANPQRSLAQEIMDHRLNRLMANMPVSLYDSAINNQLLVRSPLLIFELVTNELNLNKLIANDGQVSFETKELVAICAEWVKKLKKGL